MAFVDCLVGGYAEFSVNGVQVALCTDWRVELDSRTHPFEGPGDTWRYDLPVVTGWTFSAKGWLATASPTYVGSLWKASGQPPSLVVTGWDGKFSTSTKLFEGTGYPRKGSFEAPMELMVQQFEIIGYGPPTTGVTA